ncbi:MAG TPA: hypothetical protein VGP47_10950, partial [Parachlamydiaceae bacterium]|nr:hypothetical protein [Parachlamydiaceae bacterium]
TTKGTGIQEFDPDAIIWKPAPLAKDDQQPPLLIFPHYNDEQGNLMAFSFIDDKWTWQSSKQWYIADEQVINGIHGLKRYLVLENTEGEKEVIFPKQTLTQLKTLDSFSSTCERMKLEDGKPASRSPTKNAYLAYLALAHAITPADYAVAMDYLKNAFRFEAYSGEDLRILGWIFNLTSEKPDHIGSMDAVRLYAAWLVHDNLKRNPSKTEKLHIDKPPEIKEKKPDLNAPEGEWKEYWNNDRSWKSKKNKQISKTLNSQLIKLTTHYLARRKTVGHSVKLENILDAQELLNWGMATRTEALRHDNTIARIPSQQAKIFDLCTVRGFSPKSNSRYQVIETVQVFYTRPGEQFVKSFKGLYKAAKSTDPWKRQKVQQIINGMANDITRNNSGLKSILQAALVLTNGFNPEAQQVIFAVDKILEQGFKVDDERRLVQDLNSKLKAFVDSNQIDVFPASTKPEKIPLKDIIPPHTTHTLPLTPPEQAKMDFKPTVGIAELDTLYHQYFDLLQTPFAIEKQKEFELITDDSFIEESIKELNSDLIKGTESNQALPKHEIKNKNILTAMINTLQFELEILHGKETGLLSSMHKEMMDLARKPSEDLEIQLLNEAAILSGKKALLSENDCIALFLLGDPAEFKRITNLTSEKDIQRLYQTIGDYLLLSHKVGHIENIQKDVAKIDNLLKIETSSQIEQAALLQKIGEGLAASEQIDFTTDPTAFIVLENGLNLYMKKDQVEGLRDMLTKDGNDPTRFRSILLQRIQGGGKTLIFGPTIALLKADGYHLSIHVPSTAQYSTALYDMQHISGKIFGQKERTLEFDDDPQRYTVEYLSWMKDTMTRAVVEREYITMTNETLRAMRCKYIKERLIIKGMLASSNGLETPEIAELEQKNSILKGILKMMRGRGVFTFDEVHLATNPTKELNMPFGSCTSILSSEAKLVGKLLQFSATVKNKNGLLLKLCENQQSQQKEDEYSEMLKIVAGKLALDPWMQMNLKILKKEMTQDETEELVQYFLGIRENIPAFIDNALAASAQLFEKDTSSLELKTLSESLKGAADLIVLAKQMLAGQWLRKRLEKSVDVH